ncbi:hypothetical protein Pcac1_g11919 [Phytophthora cactorum]|nr:hypothetical protein Pcac1_g11919 [Phytophthora cactorum]KAG3029340.1 hypothetical protein PC120_g4361 [Phytophthora cactorum]
MLSRHPDYDPCTTSGRHAAGDAEDEEECAVYIAEAVAAADTVTTCPLRDAIAAAYEHDATCSEMFKYLKAPSDSARWQLSPLSRSRVDRYVIHAVVVDWTARTLINPGQQRRSIAYREASGATEPAVASFMNFDPNPEPQHRDAAVVRDLVQRHESVTRYVRDAVATAVDRQKEYADQRWRKNLEEKNCRRRSFFFYLRPAFNLP